MPSKFLARGEYTQLEIIADGGHQLQVIATDPGSEVTLELSITECLNLRDFFVNTYGLSDDNIKASKLYQEAVNNAVDSDPIKEPAPVPTIETVHILREQHREMAGMIADLATVMRTTL